MIRISFSILGSIGRWKEDGEKEGKSQDPGSAHFLSEDNLQSTIINQHLAVRPSAYSSAYSSFFHLRMGGRDYCLPRLCVPSLHPSERPV